MLVRLNSVQSIIDTETLYVYPMGNGDIDTKKGKSILEVDNEWFQTLSEEDAIVVNKAQYTETEED